MNHSEKPSYIQEKESTVGKTKDKRLVMKTTLSICENTFEQTKYCKVHGRQDSTTKDFTFRPSHIVVTNE